MKDSIKHQVLIEQSLNARAVLEELLCNEEYLKDRGQEDAGKVLRMDLRYSKCPRCKAISRLITQSPYCSACNWDSLTDPSSVYPAA
jgi:hypothetical protein